MTAENARSGSAVRTSPAHAARHPRGDGSRVVPPSSFASRRRRSTSRRHFRCRAFSLIELLVAMTVFAALAAAAYGGLAQIARTCGALAVQQDRFANVMRAVSSLERDLRQAVSRSVRAGSASAVLPALAGTSNAIEWTRLGYANPRAEARSHLQRVSYALDGAALRRARWAVLDRAPASTPQSSLLLDRAGRLQLRYLGCDGAWREAWPPSSVPACAGVGIEPNDLLPQAVEFRFAPEGLGDIRRLVELPATPPPPTAGGTP